MKYFLQKTTKPICITVLIFSFIIITSVFYLNWKDVDKVHELEAYHLALEVSNRVSMVNAFLPESDYLAVVGLTQIEKFPVPSIEYLKNRTKLYWYNEANSLSDLIQLAKENGLTHLVIDDNPKRPQFIKDVLINENNFPYLIKEFDSLEEGYKYHLKIYRIDYEKFNLINELR